MTARWRPVLILENLGIVTKIQVLGPITRACVLFTAGTEFWPARATVCQSQGLRGVRRGSAAARLLGLWV